MPRTDIDSTQPRVPARLRTYNFPWEILSSIFRFGQLNDSAAEQDSLRLGEDHVPRKDPGVLPFEVQVSHISGQWRRVALGTPSLWTTICVEPVVSLSELEAYLQRSRPCPLDVSITCDGPPYDDEHTQEHKERFVLALAHINRWRRCWFHSSREDRNSPFITLLIPARAPALEYLSIEVQSSNHNRPATHESYSAPQIFSGGCPRLSLLHMHGLSLYFFRPPLRTVTTLYIHHTKNIRVQYPEFHTMLNACPALLYLSICGDMMGDQIWLHANSIKLPNLRTLSISSFRASNYSHILLTLDTPRLEKIILKDAREHDLDPFLTSPHTSKFPLLHSLVFCDSDFTVLTYHTFFTSFPSVSELTFIGNSYVPDILKSISDAAHFAPQLIGSYSLWPQLQVLNIDLGLSNDVGLLLKDALERRLRTGGRGPTKLRLGITVDEDFREDDGTLDTASDYGWLQENITIEVMEGSALLRLCCE
ncbi:hypothetical protein V5O48_004963 [Marasmius crinis-equi]|uniref:F-box domain-containing protein n=1 Tax=Marasmius crinis-equi TaxID=585013 RepID=A0ABR3FNN9_9AGAR